MTTNLTFNQEAPDRAVLSFSCDDAAVVITVHQAPDTGEGVHFDAALVGAVRGEIVCERIQAGETHGLFTTFGFIIEGERLIQAAKNVIFVQTRELIR